MLSYLCCVGLDGFSLEGQGTMGTADFHSGNQNCADIAAGLAGFMEVHVPVILDLMLNNEDRAPGFKD